MTQQKLINDFDQKHFVKLTKKRFKKKFKKTITAKEINKIWKDFVQHGIIQPVLNGDCVKIDKHSSIQLVGTPRENDSRLMRLLTRGKIQRSDGSLTKIEKLGRREEKFAIVYINRLAKGKIHFRATTEFKKQVRNALNNTNTYFHINEH